MMITRDSAREALAILVETLETKLDHVRRRAEQGLPVSRAQRELGALNLAIEVLNHYLSESP